MTTLMAERRPESRARDEASRGPEGRQQSLFGGEALAPPRPSTPPPWQASTRAPGPDVQEAPTPAAAAPAGSAVVAAARAPETIAPPASPESLVAATSPVAAPKTITPANAPVRVPEALAAAPSAASPAPAPEVLAPAARPSGAPLTRPTLDDAISRAWEGLRIGLPAACPVCGDELRPALGGPVRGSCGSCGASID